MGHNALKIKAIDEVLRAITAHNILVIGVTLQGLREFLLLLKVWKKFHIGHNILTTKRYTLQDLKNFFIFTICNKSREKFHTAPINT